MDAREAVEEGLGQASAAAALLHWVLRCEDPEGGRALEAGAQLWNVHLRPVIEKRVQTLQHALTCKSKTTYELLLSLMMDA